MVQDEFEKLVEEAVLDLPQDIREMMTNVAITIDEIPNMEQLGKNGVRQGDFLLGLYEGVPQTSWGKGFGNHLPDKITIFAKSITQFAKTPEEIQKLVKNVVWHEIAHHFGINEKEVRRLERKWSSKL